MILKIEVCFGWNQILWNIASTVFIICVCVCVSDLLRNGGISITYNFLLQQIYIK
jgi:hypothetical protein